MQKHSLTIELQQARNAYYRAQEECVHWDYEHGPDAGHDCCAQLESARRKLSALERENVPGVIFATALPRALKYPITGV